VALIFSTYNKAMSFLLQSTNAFYQRAKFTYFSKKEGFYGLFENVHNLKVMFNKGVTKTRPTGFGPVTYGLEIRCSIQLSYGRNSLFYNILQEFVV
jgi:hypothetical protein